jgi:hypothetical protein
MLHLDNNDCEIIAGPSNTLPICHTNVTILIIYIASTQYLDPLLLQEAKTASKKFVKSNKVLSIGILTLLISITLVSASSGTMEIMGKCTERIITVDGRSFNTYPPGTGSFEPGDSYTSVCNYNKDIGQDLYFWGHVWGGGADSDAVSTHLEIKDPNGNIIFENVYSTLDIAAQVKPTLYGNYSAQITNVQDPSERLNRREGSQSIYYGFGHLTSHYKGVDNPLGDTFSGMNLWGHILRSLAFYMIMFGIVSRGYKYYKKYKSTKRSKPANVVWRPYGTTTPGDDSKDSEVKKGSPF